MNNYNMKTIMGKDKNGILGYRICVLGAEMQL
jgi:hypothetical protein